MIGCIYLTPPITTAHIRIITKLPGSLKSIVTINEHKNSNVANIATRIK